MIVSDDALRRLSLPVMIVAVALCAVLEEAKKSADRSATPGGSVGF